MTVRVLTHWTRGGVLHQGDVADCPTCGHAETTGSGESDPDVVFAWHDGANG